MGKTLRTKSFLETYNLGKKMAQELLSSSPPFSLFSAPTSRVVFPRTALPLPRGRQGGEGRKGALVVGLEGDLGGGKTTFVQGFAKGLGIKEKILSPTFVILKKFFIPKPAITKRKGSAAPAARARGPEFKILFHIDCYRIEESRELFDLGFKKIISDPKNIVIIEWADKVRKILPREATILKFEFIDKSTRRIVLK